MGVALHRRVFEAVSAVPATGSGFGPRYRIAVLGSPKTAWRCSSSEAMADAVDMGLASWDAVARAHFLAIPIEMEIDMGDRRS